MFVDFSYFFVNDFVSSLVCVFSLTKNALADSFS